MPPRYQHVVSSLGSEEWENYTKWQTLYCQIPAFQKIYPPKDFHTPSIHNIHCLTLAFSPCHRTWLSWNNPIGIRWQTPRWVLWSNPFSRVPVTPSGISCPERELKSVHLCTYHVLLYFPKVIPGFCNKSHMFASCLQCGMMRCPEEDTRRRLYTVYIVVSRSQRP